MMVRVETDRERFYLFFADLRVVDQLIWEDDLHELHLRELNARNN